MNQDDLRQNLFCIDVSALWAVVGSNNKTYLQQEHLQGVTVQKMYLM